MDKLKKAIDVMMASMGRRITARAAETWTTKDRLMLYVKDHWQTIMTKAGVDTSNPLLLLSFRRTPTRVTMSWTLGPSWDLPNLALMVLNSLYFGFSRRVKGRPKGLISGVGFKVCDGVCGLGCPQQPLGGARAPVFQGLGAWD